ncbi:hypothetical protein GIY56_14925 [Paracoccus sp. YIM 132242]|uniref:Uncharacterized protein n=1 Tax=Paracoccus lichenicola TaxID=2665644 RepID=A0A6L6HT69_9RHOB|nr:hypothetical protein [Paracoccus lichenicola]MTE01579.1 hypothetical protein [Paracoccus lichenicola]
MAQKSRQMIDPAEVNGWGVDADPKNDPTYPMRDRAGDTKGGMDWDRPPLQRADIEVLRSMEYNRRPAVFGTASPPSGLSGMVRRAAFGYSESDWRHWLMLLGADRINMVEGIVGDLAHGHVPNLPAEMGMGAEWRHNRDGLVRKLAIGAAVTVVAVALWGRRDDRSHDRRPVRRIR